MWSYHKTDPSPHLPFLSRKMGWSAEGARISSLEILGVQKFCWCNEEIFAHFYPLIFTLLNKNESSVVKTHKKG